MKPPAESTKEEIKALLVRKSRLKKILNDLPAEARRLRREIKYLSVAKIAKKAKCSCNAVNDIISESNQSIF
jgi:hypothetical protein